MDKVLIYVAAAITFLTCFQVYFFKEQMKANEELYDAWDTLKKFFSSFKGEPSKKEDDDMPMGRYSAYLKKNDLRHDGRECAICLIEFKEDDKVKTPRCSNLHVFHKKCLGKKVKVCPMCRAKI